MKIAIVLNTSWNIYNFRKGLVESLQNHGHEVFAVAPEDRYTEKVQSLGCQYIPVRMDSRGVNPAKDFFLILELFSIYKRIKPDIILHFTIKPNIYGTIAASLLRIPVINNVCGLGTVFLREGLSSKIAIWLYKLAFRFPKKIFFQNEDDHNLFLEKGIVKTELCELVPGSGIDLNQYVPTPKTVQRPFTFLLVSRLIYDKGVVEYVEAIEELRKKGVVANFQLLGSIDEKHKRGIPKSLIEKWVTEHKVDYLGSTDDVQSFLCDADCVVLPSYREGTPKTLLEAASMGLPLVATDVPGCRNIVEDGYNGFLCKSKDAIDLASKMEKLLTLNAEDRKIMGDNSRLKAVNNFDENIVIEKYHRSILSLKSA